MNHEVYEIQPPRPGRRSDLREQIVAVRGGGMCLRISGVGAPTVIFDSAIRKGRDAWNEVFSELAQLTRVCSYDRKGIGGSTIPRARIPSSSREWSSSMPPTTRRRSGT